MPLPKNVKYGMKKTKAGMMRYAFIGKKMVEAKNMKTGATHTPKEFAADTKKRAKKKK